MTGKDADRLSTGKYESGTAWMRRDCEAKVESGFGFVLRRFSGTGRDACTELPGMALPLRYGVSQGWSNSGMESLKVYRYVGF